MADVVSASPDSAPVVKFSVGEESVSVEVDSLLAQDGHGDAPPRSSSRFKVAKVEFVNEPEEMTDERPTPASPATPPPKENGIVRDGARGSASERLNSESTSTSCSPHLTDGTYSYDTHNLKTFGHNTLETLPHLDHYRNLLSATGAMRKRPTLLELHEYDKDEEEEQLVEAANNGGTQPNEDGVTIEQLKTPQAIKFGWIKGVLVRCLLNIYGVMLFLRLSWVVGQAGVALTSLVILLSAVVTMITALSMSAICTNGQVKGGGAYFMISRSLGPEFGGAIGLVFSMANAVAVAMYVVGFAETIRDLLKWNDLLMIDEINDVRIIGAITIIALLGIALIGMEWETRAQLALLAILLIAIANFAIGTFLPPSDSKKAKGFVGYQADVFKANWGPDFSAGEDFFSVFSIFFPAATGILAGANISGDLADAQSAIPKGTLLAILISMSTYVAMAWMAGSCMLRSVALGGSTDWIGNGTLQSGYVAASVTASSPSCVDTKSCPYGLLNDMQMMQLTSAFGPITVAGIISATLSSALASLVSAPKVFQAVCKDKIFPGIHIFARGYGKSEEPRLAYILAFCIGLACIGIGQLNAIAPLISNFFLMSYALINYSCFDASLAKSPGWRPAFRYYSMWLSLLGAVICLVVMFIISWYTAFVTLGVVATLYTYVHYRKPDVNWGSSTQAHVYRSALQHTLKLTSVLEHVKNFRPQLLVMSGFPADRPALVDIAANISKNVGLMVCGQVIQGNPQEKLINTKFLTSKAYTWMHNRKVKAFYSGVTAQSLRAGAQCLLQGPGIGKLRPNTLLLGFKTNWLTAPQAQVVDYINIIHDAFDLRYGVGILRLADGLHCSEMDVFLPPDEGVSTYDEESGAALDNGVPLEGGLPPSSGMPLEGGIKSVPLEGVPLQTESSQEEVVREIPRPPSSHPSSQPMDDTFRRKHKGTIDVWWLFDDGGLTLLIPYLLTTNSLWQGCKLRVFAAGTKTMELDRDQRHMATLLSKFRIEYSSMTVVQDIGKRPDPSLYTEFCSRLGNWMLDTEAGETEETHPWKISENELSTQKEKTFRNIRLRQLLKQYSSDAKLIVMTLPMPKKGLLSSGLYMAWLDTLSRDMPPILLLRGNQTSVLTYYS